MDHDPLHSLIKGELDRHLRRIEAILDADAISIISQISWQLFPVFRAALDDVPAATRKKRLVVILTTVGGMAEVAQRMVNLMRHLYDEVLFIVPDMAMSAGTILVMSGDEILMTHGSCLGPIDPQVEINGTLVPALAALKKLEEWRQLAAQGQLTMVEATLINKMSAAEIRFYEQARTLSVSLLKQWLTKSPLGDHRARS